MKCEYCNVTMEYVVDYSGGTYTTYLWKCPECGKVHIIKFEEDQNLNINFDKRFYEYKKSFYKA